ncbi:MAG TPA: TPM domain-containing protein, partial [Flavobacteriales bacterium]|nr:TPM domain-containing protein [Flavobacteriales bacterium]
MRALTAAEWLSPTDLDRVRQAVHLAESRTSGEIRVHLDDTIVDDVLDHAAFVFEELGMHRTKHRNAALIYVSVAEQ